MPPPGRLLIPKYTEIHQNNNKTWILFAMSAYSFDEVKFTSAQNKKEKKKKTISKTPKFIMHNPPGQ